MMNKAMYCAFTVPVTLTFVIILNRKKSSLAYDYLPIDLN